MASLSLPRVLQLKKNSLDAEREQFEKFQTLAIQKAINSLETPVKEKHVRSTIIGTFQEQSAITYWMVAIRLPLQDNRIVAWKFCHVTHKLLREGHPACLDDSQRHISMIENLGRLWVHLREGYGRLVHLYCNLLVCKLKFHARNPRFPGNMLLTAEELDAIAENDINNYFQLCVELFDYMDEILNLQASVFDSLGNARANSMTASGQCRLAALIPCAQDSSHIYDCNVRLLFKLHAALPADTLAGHRERFRQQFKKLSSFYKHASSLQYYRNLLTLPVLPSNPPNFLQQSDFGTYVAPVVSIPEPPPDEVDAVGSLIDTSDTISLATTPDQMDAFETRATPSPQPDPVVERDRLIDHLQNELKRMRSEVSQLVQDRTTMANSMREHCMRLETQLHSTKAELEEEKRKSETLSAVTPEIKQKLTETEEKAKVTDEKFQKLKGAYTQLREEHINLIRQKAEVDKLTANLRTSAAQHESAKMALQQQLNDRIKDVEILQQSASTSEEIEAYKSEISTLRSDLEQSRQKELELETLRHTMEALEIEHKTVTVEQENKLTTLANELKEVNDSLIIIKQEKEEKEKELVKVREELVGLREKSGDEYKRVVEERELALKQVEELKQQHQQEKEEQDHCVRNLQVELEKIQKKLTDVESDVVIQLEHKNELEEKSHKLEKSINERDIEMKEAVEKLEKLQSELQNTERNVLIQSEFNTELTIVNNELKETLLQKELKINETLKEFHLLQTRLENTEKDIATHSEHNKDLITIENQLEEALNVKDAEIKNAHHKLLTLESELASFKQGYYEKIQEKDAEIDELQDKIMDLVQDNETSVSKLTELESERDQLMRQLKEVEDGKNSLQQTLTQKDVEMTNLENKIRELHEIQIDQITNFEEADKEKAEEISRLQFEIMEKKNEINCLQNVIREHTDLEDTEKSKSENLLRTVSELKSQISDKNKEIEDLQMKLEERVSMSEKEKIDFQSQLKESQYEITMMKEKLQTVVECKDEIIKNLKETISEKDNQVIQLNVEVNKLSVEVSRLEDELKETQAELEIGKNELMTLREEHDNIVERNQSNLTLKNTELRTLHEEVNRLKLKKKELIENELSTRKKFGDEKLVLEEKINNLESFKEKIEQDCQSYLTDIDNLKTEYDNLKQTKDEEIKVLRGKLDQEKSELNKIVTETEEIISESKKDISELKTKLIEMERLNTKEKEKMDEVICIKDKEFQSLENKLDNAESRRLNAECELQDLLQHNTIIEADMAALKRQLEEAQKELEKQTSRMLSCAGEAALEVTNEALAALERGNAQDTNKSAAEMAVRALEELTKQTEVKGNEECLSRSAITAAHNTATLSAYVTEVCNISTDMELADKLNNECRTMLSATKECLESLKTGSLSGPQFAAARSHVQSLVQAAAAADRLSRGTRSVDDELADMDSAIEQAASKIEEMLAASRAGDSGVKLEVNGNILESCTSLMAAVKMLVQNARSLQNELGDPKTRQKMYRRNPQWSEGLISAAKAVVFAAKLLVTSADEAVGASGRMEGVSAAAHEVAGSTAQLVAASRVRAPASSPALARLTQASRAVASATGSVVAAVRAGSALVHEQEALDTSALTLTATRRLEMESKVRSLELESALEAERAKLAALRKRHYQLAQLEENGNMTNGK